MQNINKSGKGFVMKKFLVIVLALFFVAGMALPGFAAKAGSKKDSAQKYERIVAEVVSLDVAAKTMVVKREAGGETRTISISEKAASQLKVGDRVRIKLKAGTNESAGVRVLKAEIPVEATTATEPEKK